MELGAPHALVGDPRTPLDNDATERAVRGPVVGRKDPSVGSKSRRGAEVAATLYPLVETAKLHDIEKILTSSRAPRARRQEGTARRRPPLRRPSP